MSNDKKLINNAWILQAMEYTAAIKKIEVGLYILIRNDLKDCHIIKWKNFFLKENDNKSSKSRVYRNVF